MILFQKRSLQSLYGHLVWPNWVWSYLYSRTDAANSRFFFSCVLNKSFCSHHVVHYHERFSSELDSGILCHLLIGNGKKKSPKCFYRNPYLAFPGLWLVQFPGRYPCTAELLTEDYLAHRGWNRRLLPTFLCIWRIFCIWSSTQSGFRTWETCPVSVPNGLIRIERSRPFFVQNWNMSKWLCVPFAVEEFYL